MLNKSAFFAYAPWQPRSKQNAEVERHRARCLALSGKYAEEKGRCSIHEFGVMNPVIPVVSAVQNGAQLVEMLELASGTECLICRCPAILGRTSVCAECVAAGPEWYVAKLLALVSVPCCDCGANVEVFTLSRTNKQRCLQCYRNLTKKQAPTSRVHFFAVPRELVTTDLEAPHTVMELEYAEDGKSATVKSLQPESRSPVYYPLVPGQGCHMCLCAYIDAASKAMTKNTRIEVE